MSNLTDEEDRLVAQFIAENEDEGIRFERLNEVNGYYITDTGRLISIKGKMPKYLKQHKGNSGYLKVTFSINNKSCNYMTHRLVAKYFISKCPDGKQVNHRDGDKLNNHATNLEYVTQEENIAHAQLLGLSRYAKGENHGHAKLTQDQVNEIRDLNQLHKTTLLAKLYNVDNTTIRRIIRGDTWK